MLSQVHVFYFNAWHSDLSRRVSNLEANVTALKSNVTGWTPIIMALITRSASAGETALAPEPAPPAAVSEPDIG